MIKEKKYYNAEELMKLDREKEFIPLTFDGMFKGLFKKNLDLLKDFIFSQIGLEIDSDMYKIQLLDSELFKDKVDEYQKTVDIYVQLNNIFVNIEINREYFKNVETRNFIFADKLHTMMLHRGDDVKTLDDNIFIQINLNAIDKYDDDHNKLKYGTDKIVYYGLDTGKVYNSNKYSYVKYLEYYRDIYYNKDEKLDKACLWLVLFTSKSFLEMYNILGKLFDDEKREQFIRNVIDMNNNEVIFQDWELQKLNELVKYTSEKNLKEQATKEGMEKGIKEGLKKGLEKGMENGMKKGMEKGMEKGIKQGIEQGIEQGVVKGREENNLEVVKNMLKENMDIELISKITNKTKEEILEIKKKNKL